MAERIFFKIGGSYLTDKTKADSLKEDRIRIIARAIHQALKVKQFELILAHGAGCYGHIKAKQYAAQSGIHSKFGWKAFYEIRNDMVQMNQRIIKICNEEHLFPITIQPSAIITAHAGQVATVHLEVMTHLLKYYQIALVHGDIVVDVAQGFTIASTEDILSAISKHIPLDRVLMISDVPGVLDEQQRVIPEINEHNYDKVIKYPGTARGTDVTGGMKNKVQQLFSLVRKRHVLTAHIVPGNVGQDELVNVILNNSRVGTMIR